MEFLTQQGLNINVCDAEGSSALDIAISKRQDEAAKWLIKSGAQLAGDRPRTLLSAASAGLAATCRALIFERYVYR